MHLSKETLRELTLAIKEQHTLERKLSESLRALFPDNYVVTTVCKQLSDALSAVYRETLGAANYDWWEWWMFDADFGAKNNRVTIDGEDHLVDTFDKFYRVCLTPYPPA